MKILITAFDPFGGEKINPALEAVKAMKDEVAGAELVKYEVPTVFDKSIDLLDKKIEEENPDAVICVGQAGGSFDISLERVAININDASIEDNEGNQPIDEAIREDGESAYFSSLPIKAMVEEVRSIGLPASISNTAGTFVCNHIMYGLLYLIDKKYSDIKGGFIHVPFIGEQVVDKRNMPFMSTGDITRALEACVKALVENDKDIKTAEGAIF